MKTIFVIGGIGSGKSSVTQFFADHGVPTLDLDTVGHNILLLPSVKDSLRAAFGNEIFDEQGVIIRRSLAARSFASSSSTETLTAITAPAIVRETKKWLAEKAEEGHAFAVVEVSAFDGSKNYYVGIANYIIAVTAPIEVRVCRAASRGFDEADIRQRIARQVSDEERRTWAHFIIENDTSLEELRNKVENIWKSLNN